MKNKSKSDKADGKLASEQLIISEQAGQTITGKPPLDKKALEKERKAMEKERKAMEKEKKAAEKNCKKGERKIGGM